MGENKGILALRVIKTVSNYFSDVLEVVEPNEDKIIIKIKEEKHGISGRNIEPNNK